jgi:hypothetical protein
VNPRLLGDEMLQWSDLDGMHGPGPARGAALAPLLAGAYGRTLVAGPHHPDLIGLLPAHDLTLLVRGVADGERLAGHFPEATVCCGGLAKFAVDEPFDTVVAMAGLERLTSAEGVEQSWGSTLDQLLGLVRPGGTVLLAVENFLGLHRLVALPGDPDDSAWTAAAEYDPTRPAGLRRVRARLGSAVRTYAAYPDPLAPTLLLGTDVLADDSLGGAVAALLSRACEPVGPELMDPQRLAVAAARHGTAADLAPAWILALGPAPELSPVLPAGRTLQELLLQAALERDLPAVRELLGTWLDGPAAGVPADQIVAGPRGALTALAPVGDPAEALRRFAALLIDGGYPHPWPTPAGAADLARTLAAMTGRKLDLADPPADEPPPGYRELLLARERLTTELAQARAKHLWYERMLTDREITLKRVQRINLLLSAAAPGRVLLSGARAVKRTARRAVRRVRQR